MGARNYLILAALVIALVSCSDDESNESTNNTMDADHDASGIDAGDASNSDLHELSCGDEYNAGFMVGDLMLSVHGDGSWRLSRGDETLVQGPANCDEPALRVLRGEPFIENSAGAFDIRLDGERAETTWVASIPSIPRFDSGGLVYELEDGTTATITFTPRVPDGANETALDVAIQLEAEADGAELNTVCRSGEEFFGLGTQVVGMGLRGHTFPLWSQEQGNGKPDDGGLFPLNNIPEAAYAPAGIWHSTRGFAALVTHDGYSEIDLCESSDSMVSLRSYRSMPGFVVVAGDTPKARMARVSAYLTRPDFEFADWGFGFWIDAVTGLDRVNEAVSAARDNDIPASAVWSEDWIGGRLTAFGFRLSYAWEWDEMAYPDLPTFVDELQAEGWAFLGYFNPFVPDTVEMHEEGLQGGYFVESADDEVILLTDPAFRDSALVDLTDQDALEWLAGYQTTAVETVGLDGWMADFAEWLPVDARMEDGREGWAFHNLYPVEWQRQNYLNSRADSKSPIIFGRSGWASANGGWLGGVQVLWGGDQDTTWEYDDGFPTIIPISTHAGLSGAPIFASDIAGYNSVGTDRNTDKELWFRWLTAGAFHPVMRTHHGGDKCNNWNFDRDQETLDHTRRWASIHVLLFPEFKRLLDEVREAGLPITRHPFLVEPDSPGLWQGERFLWFLGDDILIQPVLAEDTTEWPIRLPDAGWWPLFGDEAIEASADLANVPITEVPAYVRPGTALVLLGEAVDTFYGDPADPEVTSLVDVEGRYRIALYPDSTGAAASRDGAPFAVTATGLDTFDLADVTYDARALTACTTSEELNCVDGDRVRLEVVDGAALTAADAIIEISGSEVDEVVLGIGGAAWGDLTIPTSFTPNPDAPTWCVEE